MWKVTNNGNDSGRFSWLQFRLFIHLGKILWVEEDKETAEDVFYDSEGLREELGIEEDRSSDNGNSHDRS